MNISLSGLASTDAVILYLVAISALVTACTPVILFLMANQQKRSAEDTKTALDAATERAEEVRRTLLRTGAETDRRLETIQRQADGERTKLMKRLEEMHQENLHLALRVQTAPVRDPVGKLRSGHGDGATT